MPVRSARRPHLAAIQPNILKIVITRDGHPFTVRYVLQNYPRVLATARACATARAIRVQDALSHRESLDQPILGQLRSNVILVSKTRKVIFQIHHIAQSANVLFRLTLPRSTA